MKTTFRPRNSTRSDKKRLALVAGTLAVALLVFIFARSYIVLAVSPIWKAQNWFSSELRTTIDLVRSKESLSEENEALKQMLSTYNSLLASHRTLQSTHEELLRQFGRSDAISGIAAGVLVHPPATPYDILIVDAGSDDGVSQGMKVSMPEGGALGIISEVFGDQSKVTLYTSGDQQTAAVLERGGIPVTLSGSGGGTFEIEVPRDVLVFEGDKVLLPGIRGELVAVVLSIHLEPTDSVKRITAASVANVSSVRFVTIH